MLCRVSGEGSAPATSYTVAAYVPQDDALDLASPALTVTVTAPADSAPLPLDSRTSLLAGVRYCFVVQGLNSAGAGTPSLANTSPTCAAFPATNPSPVNMTATPGNASVLVQWQPVAWDGGAPIQQYTVTYTVDGESSESAGLNATQLATNLTRLENDEGYIVAVQAGNAASLFSTSP